MQSLKKPFYYNTKILNIFIVKKILNYHYYNKSIYCSQNINLLDTIIKQKEKKKEEKNKKNL